MVGVQHYLQHLTRAHLIFLYSGIGRIKIAKIQFLHKLTQEPHAVVIGNDMSDLERKF